MRPGERHDMGRTAKRACLNCGEPYTADARNARHQRFCTAAPCKVASKRASQAAWLAKAEPARDLIGRLWTEAQSYLP